MLKFSDLNFESHCIDNGIAAKLFFDNGYGVSVVQFPGSYGYEEGLYEVAILKGSADDYDLCYDTPVSDDILGHRDEEDVENIIKEVESL
jgi:hypothetical protein